MIRGIIKIAFGITALVIGLVILVLVWGYHLIVPKTPTVDSLVGKWEDTVDVGPGGLKITEPHHSVLELNADGSFTVIELPNFDGPVMDKKISWNKGKGTWLLAHNENGYYVDLSLYDHDDQQQKNPSHIWLLVNYHWTGRRTKLWYVWDDPDVGDWVIFDKVES